MPIETEFEVILDGQKYNMNAKITKAKVMGKKQLVWDNRAYIEVVINDSILNAKFIPIQKPVSFMEALESGKKVKVKCEGYLDIDKNYYLISEIFKKIIKGNEVFGENETEKAIKSFIINGQWYIQEDNAND